MRTILNNKLWRIILAILTLASMFIVPSLIYILLGYIGIKNDALLQILAYIIYSGILTFIFLPELKEEIKIFKKDRKKILESGVQYYLFGFLAMIVANIIINFFILNGIAANEAMNREAMADSPIWYTLLSMVVFAPYMEELVFRKSLDKIFKKPIVYALISGILFGFAHTIADLSSVLNLLYIIPYGALGFVFALMDSKHNSVFTSMFFHACHNLFTVTLLLTLVGA